MIRLPLTETDVEVGQAFHAALHDAIPWLDQHPDSDEHDEHVGRAARSALAGRLDEAVETYNEWASGAGYAPLSVLPGNRIDIRDCVLRVEGDAFEVEW